MLEKSKQKKIICFGFGKNVDIRTIRGICTRDTCLLKSSPFFTHKHQDKLNREKKKKEKNQFQFQKKNRVHFRLLLCGEISNCRQTDLMLCVLFIRLTLFLLFCLYLGVNVNTICHHHHHHHHRQEPAFTIIIIPL